MRDAVVVGRPRVGKTRFVEALSSYLGRVETSSASLPVEDPLRRGRRGDGVLSPVTVRDRRGRPWLRLVDTAALRDEIPDHAETRRAMAVSLARLQEAAIVFHLLDAAQAGRLSGYRPPLLDLEMRAYGLTRPLYVIIATKSDMPAAAEGVRRIRTRFPEDLLIAVALPNRRGLREVRRLLLVHAAR